jgi:hypothetical protein
MGAGSTAEVDSRHCPSLLEVSMWRPRRHQENSQLYIPFTFLESFVVHSLQFHCGRPYASQLAVSMWRPRRHQENIPSHMHFTILERFVVHYLGKPTRATMQVISRNRCGDLAGTWKTIDYICALYRRIFRGFTASGSAAEVDSSCDQSPVEIPMW